MARTKLKLMNLKKQKENPPASPFRVPPPPRSRPRPPPSSFSGRHSTVLASQSAFVFHKPNASLQETLQFLKKVSFSFISAKEFGISSISKFTLDFPFKESTNSSVIPLIIQALNFRVKKLKLILTNGDNVNQHLSDSTFDMLRLPSILNCNPYITKLALAMCSFDDIKENLQWQKLKKLRLSHTNLGRINQIVEGCPKLYTLELIECWGIKRLDFSNHKTLNVFLLNGVWPTYEESLDPITISGPTVESLTITGKLDLRYIILENFDNCVVAELDFYWTTGDHGFYDENGGYDFNMLGKLLWSLRTVGGLTFGTWIIQNISKNYFTTYDFGYCVELTLRAPVRERRFHNGMMRLIESCHTGLEEVNIINCISYPFCKVCPKIICIHDEKKTAESFIENVYIMPPIFEFFVLNFYSNEDGVTTSRTIGDSVNTVTDNHTSVLPEFVRYLIENPRRKLKKVCLQ